MGAHDSKAWRSGSPCIWVSAGLLSCYLCDRNFDCDHCPLHHALTRSARRSVQSATDWPEECLYTPGHLWVRHRADNSVRVGITPFGAELLNPVEKWERSPEGALKAGAPLVTAHTAAGPVPLHLPFESSVTSFNPWLSTDPLWPLADPWESGYFADVQTKSWNGVRAACPTLENLAGQLSIQRKRVGELLRDARWPEERTTQAADGGVPFGGLAAALGVAAYGLLLNELFGA